VASRTLRSRCTASKGRDKREALRTQAEAFITQEIEPEQVLSVNEMSVPMNNVFSVTVWYRQD